MRRCEKYGVCEWYNEPENTSEHDTEVISELYDRGAEKAITRAGSLSYTNKKRRTEMCRFGISPFFYIVYGLANR